MKKTRKELVWLQVKNRRLEKVTKSHQTISNNAHKRFNLGAAFLLSHGKNT